MSLVVVDPPGSEVITSEDPVLRQHLRLEDDENDQNDLLDTYCATARQKVESYVRRRLITQTLQLRKDGFGCGAIDLAVAPVIAITEVRWLDFKGEWQTLDPLRYRLLQSTEPAQIEPEYGMVWPVPRTGRDTVQIDFTAGYGEDASSVPPVLAQAIREFAGLMFLKREGSELPASVVEYLDPWRVWV